MDCISSALAPIKAIVWGEQAMHRVGVRLAGEHTIVVVEDVDFEESVRRFRSADFPPCDWSFGSHEPEFYQGPIKKNIYRDLIRDFSTFDSNSARFFFPPDCKTSSSKAVLLRSSYAHISLQSTSLPQFTCEDNLFWPDSATLLKSFVQTLTREPDGLWRSTLEVWAIAYLYGQLLTLSDDVLDSLDDKGAQEWFNDKILRYSGGLDRITCTKRLGRVGYDERLARIP